MSATADQGKQLSTATMALFTIRDALAILTNGDVSEMEEAPVGVAAIIRMAEREATWALRAIEAES